MGTQTLSLGSDKLIEKIFAAELRTFSSVELDIFSLIVVGWLFGYPSPS